MLSTLIELRRAGERLAPSHDFLVILPEEAPERTAGGIYLPNGQRQATQIGKIIAAGPGNISPFGQMIPMDHTVGDVVVVNPMAHVMEVKVEGVTHLLVRDCDCLGRIVAPDQPAAAD